MFLLKVFTLVFFLYGINFIKTSATFSLSYLPLNNLKFGKIRTVIEDFKYSYITQLLFLPKYYLRNELIWGDGFLIDFLQKKSVDIWLRKFIIYTGFIFSERLVFDQVVRFYLENLLWPLHYVGIFETNNIIETLSTVIALYFIIFSFFFFFLIILI